MCSSILSVDSSICMLIISSTSKNLSLSKSQIYLVLKSVLPTTEKQKNYQAKLPNKLNAKIAHKKHEIDEIIKKATF